MERFDVTALGELLVDFTESGVSPQGNPLLEANPGGAPCNVLAMLAKLGHPAAFIGKVGSDSFGRRLMETVAGLGIDTRGLLFDEHAHTTLAFVHRTPDGDRDFTFCRDHGADTMLRAEEVPETLIASSRIFHFGSLSMTHAGVRGATAQALRYAKRHGCLVSFDPNLRPALWNSPEEARAQIAFGLTQCDVLKIADDELRWFTGLEDPEAGLAALREVCDIPLILLSRGRDGSTAVCRGARADAPAFLLDGTVDTTGAGDCFCACALHFILEHGLDGLTGDLLGALLRYANAAAAIVTTRKGALRVMPEPGEIEALLAERG